MLRVIKTICFIVVFSSLKAQRPGDLLIQRNEKNLIIKNWTVEEGIASNSVRKIGKANSGFLFLATYNGISLFDGKNFINYSSNNVSSIKANNINDFCMAKDSSFWIGTYRGIVVFNGKHFYVPENLKEIERYSIQCINFDKSGTLWIGTTSNGLFTYRNGKIRKVDEIKDLEKTIISMLYSDNEGNVWIGTEKGDLYKYDGENYYSPHQASFTNGIYTAMQDSSGFYYFGTRNGLYTYRNDSLLLINRNINFINDIQLDKNGQAWIATNSGLYFFNKKSKKIYSVFIEKNLANQIIQSVYFDDEDMIWIGTYRKGLIQLRIGAFQNFPFSINGIEEIPSAIAELNDSTLWIGTDEGKILELQNGLFKEIKINSDITNSRIKCVYIDSKNTKWICSYNGLVQIKNGQERLLGLHNGFPDNTFRSIIETKDGNFWVATRQSGIHLINENLERLQTINTENGLSSNFVMALINGKDGKIFVATKNGLDVIKDRKIIAHYSKNGGLAEDMVFNVYEDDNHVVWIATINGLSRLENNQFTNFYKKNGLVDDKIFDIVEDEFGYFWLPVVNGIIRVKKSELNEFANKQRNSIFSVLFDKSDGIYDQQYVSASKALKTNKGNIVVNTISGISILNPKIANTVSSNQSLFIKSITTESGQYFNNQDIINLPSSSKYLQFDYSYIDFINPDKVEFRYRLEPFDYEWQHAGKERFAKYTNLPPGEYNFLLQAFVKAQGGYVLEKSITFTIQPAFYETVWFKIFMVLIFMILIRFLYVLRVRTIEHQKENLEKIVEERTTKIIQQKDDIEKHLKELEVQKEEIAEKNEEIVVARNKIEQAYINLKLLSDLGKEITSSLSEEEIITILFRNINILMDIDLLSIGIYDQKSNKLHFNSTYFKGNEIPLIEKELNSETCIISYSIENELNILTNDFTNEYPNFKFSFPEIDPPVNMSSVIVFPIRVKNEIIGVLTAQSAKKDSYSEYHFNLIENLAVYVGIAMENTKTYTEIQKQKDELQQVNASKDKMFSIIGHDLRGPVGTIKSFLDLIIENPEITNAENMINIFKTMQQSLGSAYTLLDNLLLWASSQRGQLEYNPTQFFIKQPIDESISLVSESARVKEISIETKIYSNIAVFADQNMITTVMRNLISNAIKFTPRKGNIQIITSAHKVELNGKILEQVEVKVVDNGIGISKNNLDKILKLNELFSTPGTDKEQGSGLGIGICIDFLKMHNQKLFVENNKEMNNLPGSTFKFYLNKCN